MNYLSMMLKEMEIHVTDLDADRGQKEGHVDMNAF